MGGIADEDLVKNSYWAALRASHKHVPVLTEDQIRVPHGVLGQRVSAGHDDGSPAQKVAPQEVAVGDVGWAPMLPHPAPRAAYAAMMVRDRRREGLRVCRAAWLIGVLIFNLWLRFASVRYLLPALPPSILLLQRVLPNPDGPAVRYGADGLAHHRDGADTLV